jgi:uncharacterized membrane protein YeaQ/YmgE (transglycosylase-associated protein family)
MEDAIVELGLLGIIGWVFFGLIVGLMARAILPGRDPMGLIATAFLGVVGALLGGWLGQALGLYAVGSRAGFLGAVIGAVLVLAIYRRVALRRAERIVQRALRGGEPRSRFRGRRWREGSLRENRKDSA